MPLSISVILGINHKSDGGGAPNGCVAVDGDAGIGVGGGEVTGGEGGGEGVPRGGAVADGVGDGGGRRARGSGGNGAGSVESATAVPMVRPPANVAFVRCDACFPHSPAIEPPCRRRRRRRPRHRSLFLPSDPIEAF